MSGFPNTKTKPNTKLDGQTAEPRTIPEERVAVTMGAPDVTVVTPEKPGKE